MSYNTYATKQNWLKNFIGVWRSLVARLTGGQEAMGSSPVTPTKKLCECKGTRIFIYNRNLCEVRTVEIVYKTAEKLCRVS